MSKRTGADNTTAQGPRVGIAKAPHISGSPGSLDTTSIHEVKALVSDAISRALSLPDLVRGKKVLLKPNLVRPNRPDRFGIVTDPRVILATALLVQEAGAARVAVGENPGYGVSSREALDTSNVASLLKEHDIDVCYLDEEPMVTSESPRARFLRKTVLPRAVLDWEVLVNIPKLKTHIQTVVSLGIKNLHGLLPDGERLRFHRQDVHQKMVDIMAHRRPSMTVVDGIWAGEGQAPLFGSTLKDLNVIVAGEDVVAVDTVAVAIMGISPEEVPMIRIAHAQGHGSGCLEEIEVVGPRIEEVRHYFRRAVISSAGCFPNVMCLEGGACNGCLSNLRHSLDKLHKDGRLGEARPITVYVGRPMPRDPTLETWEGDLWLFGDCSLELECSQGEGRCAAHTVRGCPPHILDFAKLFEATYRPTTP